MPKKRCLLTSQSLFKPGHPVLVAGPHERRVPLQLAAQVQECLLMSQRADPPLAARHYFQRPVALLVELDGVGYGTRFAPPSRPTRAAARRRAVGRRPPFSRPVLRYKWTPPARSGRRGPPARAARRARRPPARAGSSSRHQTTSVTSPKVHTMAAPVPLSGWANGWATTGHGCPEQRRRHGGADQGRVAFVGGVDDDGDAGRQELGPGRVDEEVLATWAMENESVVGPRAFPFHQFGLGHRSTEIDVPQRRRFGRIGLAPAQEAQERQLRDAAGLFPDRRVERAPVDRKAEVTPNTSSKARSSSAVSRSQSSTKFGRLMATGSCPLARPPSAGGTKPGS